ncbi:tyrosine--tRNA ligase [Candidatus Geothermarchaeota archaeon ex4572_27]|nr:MAG: tyrosine--tRNA ligase [Candidatus Geothermarchaeota archaeon ex4572_27]
MSLDERFQLVTRDTVEVVTPGELRAALEAGRPRGYWGFECSGFMHIGMGLITGRKIIDAVRAGVDFTILLADWHSWINNKMGGDMEKIRLAGEYFIHGFTAIGVPRDKVRYVWASDLVEDPGYWELVIRIGKEVSLNRAIRALPIMGRSDKEEVREVAWLIYPLMQVADIFKLGLDMAFGGIDQRKAHMLARDVSKKVGARPPICIHTPLLPSLFQPVPASREEKMFTKMSKSRPETSIFIHDSEEEVKKKVLKGYCPPNDVETNPIFYLVKYIIFPWLRDRGGTLTVKLRGGGGAEFATAEEVEKLYLEGKIHPLDLKLAVADALNEILEPVRKYFDAHSDVLEEMRRAVGGEA